VEHKLHNSYIVYDGPSMIDGAPILGIATCVVNLSDNEKTGGMVQLIIIPNNDAPPSMNVKMGLDVSVCGSDDCVHQILGTCYVDAAKSVDSTWGAYLRGAHADYVYADVFAGREVRFGAYGDPAALPLPLIVEIAKAAGAWTGYTHQWRDERVQPYREYLMASVELAMDRRAAHKLQWRPFRVEFEGIDPTIDPVLDAALPPEMECPATPNGPVNKQGKHVQCINCLACHGTSTDGRNKNLRHVVIRAHGAVGKRTKYSQVYEAIMSARGEEMLPMVAA